MATQAEIDQILAVVEEKLGEREARVKAYEMRRLEIHSKIETVREVAVAALRDTDRPSLADIVSERLAEIAGEVISDE